MSSQNKVRSCSRHHPLRRYHCLLIAALLTGRLQSLQALAAPTDPNTVIENQATGSFLDDVDNNLQNIVSNKVTVTVAEVAGITVTVSGSSGQLYPGGLAYFDFIISNKGNDPTQFFIPGTIAIPTNGTQAGNIKIIGYDPDGTTFVDLASSPVDIPSVGIASGDPAILDGNGSINPGGSIKVRVPVRIDAAAPVGGTVSVIFGDTGANDNSSGTQNQVYSANTSNFDIYTVDNSLTDNGDFSGDPMNGDSTNHRQEASALATALIKATPVPLPGLGVCSAQTFTSGNSNWRSKSTDGFIEKNDYGPATWTQTEGNLGEAIKQKDEDSYWQEIWTPELAVNNYLTDYSNLVGKVLSFDHKNPTGVKYNVYVSIAGTNGQTYFFNFLPQLVTPSQWQKVVVPMDASKWTKTFDFNGGAVNGNPPTDAEFLAVLSSLDHIGISIEGGNGPDTTLIDNMSAPCFFTGAIAGTVFEDPNYGGGAGRPLMTTTGTSVRDGATVELYKGDGTYYNSAITSGGGRYTFVNLPAGDYKVRVVNSTVTSDRPKPASSSGLFPVQTFRTDVSTGTVVSEINRVGGELPAEIDAPANTTSQTLTALNAVANQEVQSITPIKLIDTSTPGAALTYFGNLSGMDFGYNFDTIVNTNDSGQGSLRQFITNSNILANTGLSQVGQTPGKEASIFMIPDGKDHLGFGLSASQPNQLTTTGGNKGAAVIKLATNLSITDANTSLDASTQTTNVGDTNSGTVGTPNATVGVDKLPLSNVPRPEVVLDLTTVPANTNAIVVTGSNTLLKGFASYGYRTTSNLGTTFKSAIVVKSTVTDANATTITQLLGGTMADGSNPGVPTSTVGYTIQTAGAANINNNFFAYNSDAIEFANTNGTKVNFSNNELFDNGPKDNNGVNASGIGADQMETVNSAKNLTIIGNLVRSSSQPLYTNAEGRGLQISIGATGITVDNNTFIDNNVAGVSDAGQNTKITKNIITGTKATGLGVGAGISVTASTGTGLSNLISQNSIYQNAKLGIDHGANALVDPNDGSVNAALANNGMDYPVITISTLSGNTLTVKGFVGKLASSSNFVNAKLEFFIADDDANQNGAVILSDGRNKPHGEGKTFLPPDGGSCTTDANSRFVCTFSTAGTLGLTDPLKITATATDGSNNTSEFSASPYLPANVKFVKRITGIKPKGGSSFMTINPNDSTPLDTKDNSNPLFPANYIVGATTNGGTVQPGDELEYTIYYLNEGENNAQKVKLCDKLDPNLTFNLDTYGTGKGMRLILGDNTTTDLTNANDPTTIDRGQLILGTLDSTTQSNCNFADTSNPSGTISIDLTGTTGAPTLPRIPGIITPGTPNVPTYGRVKFTAKVK